MAERSTALVTGASKGAGLDIARGLGRLGRVWIGSRDEGCGEAAAATLRREGLDARLLPITATDPTQHQGRRTPEQGAIGVHLATLLDDGPDGGFFDDAGRLAW